MTLAGAQAIVRDLILADAALAAFGTPLLYSALVSETTSKAALAERLQASGVCIEIGMPEVAELQVTGSGGMFSAAIVPVFVAESPAVAHVPSWLALVDAVIEALIDSRRPAGGLQLLGTQLPLREGGYVLHVLAIAVPMRHG